MTTSRENRGEVTYLAPAYIIKEFFRRRASGECTFTSSSGSDKSIFFRNGIIIFSSSTFAEDRLGNVLLRKGIISQSQFDESSRRVRETKKKQGTLLVQMGALTPKGLFNGLNIQVREIIHSLLGWDSGSWTFQDRLPPQDEIVTLRIQPAPVVFEGIINGLAREDRFRKHWASVIKSLQVNADPPWPLEDLRLPPAARSILDAVASGTPPADTASFAGMTPEDTAALTFVLSVFDMLTPAGEKQRQEAAAAAAVAEKEPEQQEAEELPTVNRIEELHAKIERYNLYQVLRLDPGAGRDSVKHSYIALAKEYHPDRFFESRYDGVRDKINGIFMKINEAYTTLSNPARKAEYDRTKIKMETRLREQEDPERDSKVARQQFKRGMETLKGGDAPAAIESLRWAVHLNPRNADYHSWLGVALTKTRKRLHEAEEHCKTAIALEYSKPLYYVHLGEVYRTGKLLAKARKQFETALKLDPAFAPAKEALAMLKKEAAGDKGLMNKIFRK